MKISISDEIGNDFKKFIKKRFLSDDISHHIESLITHTLTSACIEGYDTDKLTGVGNRATLERYINKETHGTGWDDHSLYNEKFLCLDISNFKRFVDVHGMAEGDNFLRLLADKLVQTYSKDRVFRFGGDEFVVVLGQGSVCEFPKKESVTVKYSVVTVATKRNQKHSHYINGEIVHSLAKGIIESKLEGNHFDAFIGSKGSE